MMTGFINNPVVLVFLAIGGACLGFLLGFVVRGFFRRKPKEEKKTEAPKAKPVAKPANRNLEEVAHLWRDQRDGRLIFQIDNEYYKRSNELTPKEQKILLKVVMDFYQWLEPPSVVQSQPEEPVQASVAVESAPLPVMPPEKPEPKKVSFSPVQAITQALKADVSAAIIPSESIVVQIDAILQEKLIAADMQKWAVRLAEFPGRGMVVMVGLEQYEGIDAVPYERVRKMIRDAVAEWERRAENRKSE
jgi:hypothetical protein